MFSNALDFISLSYTDVLLKLSRKLRFLFRISRTNFIFHPCFKRDTSVSEFVQSLTMASMVSVAPYSRSNMPGLPTFLFLFAEVSVCGLLTPPYGDSPVPGDDNLSR